MKQEVPPPALVSMLRAARVRSQQIELRDQVCVSPRYPGHPEQYRYVFREHCESLKPRTRDKKKASVSSRPLTPLSAAATHAEISALRRVLKLNFPEGKPPPAEVRMTHRSVIETVGRMLLPHYRTAYPDPEERFAVLQALFKAGGFKFIIPRFRVLSLVLTSLEALVASPSQLKIKSASD